MSGNDEWVRRFSVDETAHHPNGFTIYKITSVLFPLESPSAVTVVSVWKRYKEIRTLHSGLKTLHGALHLRGSFPEMAKNNWTYFKRFNQEIIESRVESIKCLLDFVALHPLLFTSIQFVNFLQCGHPSPQKPSVIKEICDELQLPKDDILLPSPIRDNEQPSPTRTINNNDVENIQIFEGIDFDRQSPKVSPANSFQSIESLQSIDSDIYDQVTKTTIDNRPSVKSKFRDLINFDQPSTSYQFGNQSALHSLCQSDNRDESGPSGNCNPIGVSSRDDSDIANEQRQHLGLNNQNHNDSSSRDETDSFNDQTVLNNDPNRPINRDVNDYSNHDESRPSTNQDHYVITTNPISELHCDETRQLCDESGHNCDESGHMPYKGIVSRSETEDSYIFEAGYLLNLAARCEESEDFNKSFQYYKGGIEKLLIGVKTDNDAQRRVLVKDKIQKYISHAENIYVNHLHDLQQPMSLASPCDRQLTLPVTMLRTEYSTLNKYNVISVLNGTMLLVREQMHGCLVIKVIQKIPENVTEFDGFNIPTAMSDTKQPILPTNIPYMVPLYNYIENPNYIFLILYYAAGHHILDYIKNYINNLNIADRVTNTCDIADRVINSCNIADRGVNLDNVLTEPQMDMSVRDILMNSKKLINNVDMALKDEVVNEVVVSERVEPVVYNYRGHIPNTTICTWAAQLLLCIQHLHMARVICRDLNPNNILLGEKGQIIVTYQLGYVNYETILTKLYRTRRVEHNFYIAPELYRNVFYDPQMSDLDAVCDFWSFGAILYELICGVPLSLYHRCAFTSHTLLQLPTDITFTLEETSILTQLLTYVPSERLGSGKDGIEEIKSHPYFKNINWQTIYDEWNMPAQ